MRPATQAVCGLGREDGGSPQFSPAPIRRQSPGRRTCRQRHLQPIIMDDDDDLKYGDQPEEGVGPPCNSGPPSSLFEGSFQGPFDSVCPMGSPTSPRRGSQIDNGKGPLSVSSPQKANGRILNGSNGLQQQQDSDYSEGLAKLSPIKPYGLVPNGSDSRLSGLSASSGEYSRIYDNGVNSVGHLMDTESDLDEVVDGTRLTTCPLSSSSSSPGHGDNQDGGVSNMLIMDDSNLAHLTNNSHSFSNSHSLTNSLNLTDSINESTLTTSTVDDDSQNYDSSGLTDLTSELHSELTELWPWGDSSSSPVISAALLHKQNGVSQSSESLLESDDEEGKFDDSQTCQLRKVLREVVDTEQCYLLDLEQVINVSTHIYHAYSLLSSSLVWSYTPYEKKSYCKC